jgi:hypothetical protein
MFFLLIRSTNYKKLKSLFKDMLGEMVRMEWKKLHNGELHNLYSSPDIITHIK